MLAQTDLAMCCTMMAGRPWICLGPSSCAGGPQMTPSGPTMDASPTWRSLTRPSPPWRPMPSTTRSHCLALCSKIAFRPHAYGSHLYMQCHAGLELTLLRCPQFLLTRSRIILSSRDRAARVTSSVPPDESASVVCDLGLLLAHRCSLLCAGAAQPVDSSTSTKCRLPCIQQCPTPIWHARVLACSRH